METYEFIVLVALFLGVVGIITILEQRRRTALAQSKQLLETLTTCIGWLQAIHSDGKAQMSQVAQTLAAILADNKDKMTAVLETLSKLRNTVEGETKNSSESAVAAVDKAVVRLESALLQLQKAQDATSKSVAAKFSDVAQFTSQELLAEAKRVTKAVQDLQASLEASAKF